MRRILLTVLMMYLGTWANAQSAPVGEFWVQVRAVPVQSQAITQANRLDALFENVVGFRIGGGWYGLALGPFDRATAERERVVLLQSGLVPTDSFVANGTAFRQQFWPQGGGIPARNIAYGQRSEPAAPEPVPVVIPTPTDGSEETVAEARASEGLLTRAQKRDLQNALKWAGSYNGAIDGLYGAGTRSAMRDWQTLQGLDATGVMTTRQRAALFTAFNQVFDGLGLTMINHADAGINVQVPTEITTEATRDAPFVRYEAKDGSGISLILISQIGDRGRMQALYDVLQTLSIIPPNGERSITRRGFDIVGVDATRHTQAFVRRDGDTIKGAILVWPAGDDARRIRVANRIFGSFTPTDGALPDAYFLNVGDTPPDLVAGLDIRKPKATLTGTYLDNNGHVLTANMDFASCSRIDAGDDVQLRTVATDGDVALLKATSPVQPVGLPVFQSIPLQIPAQIV
ncbi:MAG: peptidoglycan-binding protein, partial [Planktomarina sp.]